MSKLLIFNIRKIETMTGSFIIVDYLRAFLKNLIWFWPGSKLMNYKNINKFWRDYNEYAIKKLYINNSSFCSRYFDLVRDVRQNKGSILKASVDYIKKLKVDQDRKIFLEEKCRKQEYQNKKLLLKLKVRINQNIFISHIKSFITKIKIFSSPIS